MINLKHKLTVDDLIVEYAMSRVKEGYNPSFTIKEFMKFLKEFKDEIDVDDCLEDGEDLFKRFFLRKNADDWANVVEWTTMKKEAVPHMEMSYSPEKEDYVISANYRLSGYDKSIINTYFMDNGMGKYDDYNGKTKRIRTFISEYLSKNEEKRKLDETVEVTEEETKVAKIVVAEIINYIWQDYVEKRVKYHEWPSQCKDINKYLFETDLAPIIGLPSKRDELLNLYKTLTKRLAIMYHQDKSLRITTHEGTYLARANYELLIKGNEDIMNSVFGIHKKELDLDFETLTLRESHELDGVYDFDDDPDIKTTTKKLDGNKVKVLVKNLDSENVKEGNN